MLTLRTGRQIDNFKKPYFIAELNSSHFGNISIAKEMIEKAKGTGCDCVKFQSWSAETLYSEQYYSENPISKRMVEKFSLNPEEIQELSEFCNNLDLDFASTPYSIQEAKFLVDKCNVPFIKIASMELNNLIYLKELGELNVPIILSTGMGSISEIKDAVNAIYETGNKNIAILHCVAVYPSPNDLIRLNNIEGLREAFPNVSIGFSDHSEGISIPTASIALGACIIEKHFTLDSTRIGMDNQMATEPDEMKQMIKSCLDVFSSLGTKERIVSQTEVEQSLKMRRSIVAKININAGELLSLDNLEFKRPGDGLPPTEINNVIGKKIKSSVVVGQKISFDELEI